MIAIQKNTPTTPRAIVPGDLRNSSIANAPFRRRIQLRLDRASSSNGSFAPVARFFGRGTTNGRKRENRGFLGEFRDEAPCSPSRKGRLTTDHWFARRRQMSPLSCPA